MSWLGKIIPGQTHLLSIRSSISDIYAVKMTASYPPPPAPTFLTAKEVDTGKSFSFPPFPKAAPVCQSCRAAVILLCIRGAGASPEGTSGVKAVGFMWIWDQNEWEQEDGTEQTDICCIPQTRTHLPLRNTYRGSPTAAGEGFFRNSHLSLETFF